MPEIENKEVTETAKQGEPPELTEDQLVGVAGGSDEGPAAAPNAPPKVDDVVDEVTTRGDLTIRGSLKGEYNPAGLDIDAKLEL